MNETAKPQVRAASWHPMDRNLRQALAHAVERERAIMRRVRRDIRRSVAAHDGREAAA